MTSLWGGFVCPPAWFSWESKKYEPSITLDEQLELLSLIGDMALKDGKPVVHAYAVVSEKDGSAHGGHLKLRRYADDDYFPWRAESYQR
jgi:predicted DNA-binding protein with PD1-like motif